jgi:hypothetical protein
MIGFLFALFNGDFWAEQVEDETKWHKCATPLFVRMKHGNIGQTVRRRLSNGHWDYEQADKLAPHHVPPLQ